MSQGSHERQHKKQPRVQPFGDGRCQGGLEFLGLFVYVTSRGVSRSSGSATSAVTNCSLNHIAVSRSNTSGKDPKPATRATVMPTRYGSLYRALPERFAAEISFTLIA